MRKKVAHTQRLWRRLPAWRGAALATCAVVVALVQLAGSNAAVRTPQQIGEWSAPSPWPIVAVHMALEPTGNVFALDGFDNALNSERLWDPTSGTFVAVPYGRNLFCSGHIQLPDGRTLIVGGHINANEGLADTTIFNSQTRTYFRGPDMSVGRWYPTATELPDGRVLTFSGDNIIVNRPGTEHPFKDAAVNSLPSVYDEKTNTWTDLPGARLTSPLYPFMFVLSDGRVFDAGPDKTTRILNPANWTWSTVGTSPIDGHSAVMYRPNKIMKSGTWADPDFNGTNTYNADGGTAVIDMSAPTPAWRSTAPMAYGRSYHNMTLLPDGTVLASGGESTSEGTDLTHAVLPAEIWNPDTETWTTVALLTNGREYHSTALLLPDARVLMAGGGALPGRATDQKNAEIYSPPYLFKGSRPTISSAPATANYAASFDVMTPNAAQIAKVSLIRSPAVTHAFDQNQRFQFLNFTVGAGKVTVQAPANANLAPPGDYMLFLVDSNGAPSVSTFLRVADTTAPTAPSNLTASGSPGQVTLSWTASADDGGVAHYNVHRSTTAGFTPSTANRIAQPVGTNYVDGNLGAGTYYYKVIAEDGAGNLSPASNEASATVSGGPAIAAFGFDVGSGTTAIDQSGNGNTGTLSNATWSTSGKFGKALSFNGTNASVSVPDSSSLDLTSGMTLEGWVNPNPSTDFRTMVVKEQPGNLVYGLYSNSDTNRPQSQVTVGGTARLLSGTTAVPSGSWTHIAATYDGTTERLYVNGTQVSTLAIAGTIATSNSPLKIGGNSIWSEWFNGLIDEVRVYNRALSAAEVQADMNTSITSPDATPPSAPGTLTATGSLTSAQLSWGPATDNVGVVKYNVHRATTPGFTPSTANRIAQPTGTSYTDTVAAGTYYYKVTAEDAAGNVGPASNEASATVGDTVPPSAPGTLTATGDVGKATLSWGAATDNVGVIKYNVHRSTTSGFTPTTANRIAQPTGTSYTDTVAVGTYYYKVTAEDAAGNVGPSSNEAGATVTADTTPPTAPFVFGSVTGGTVNLTWSGSTDDVGVVKYNVHRGTTPGFTPSPANRIAQPTGTSYADTGLTPGTYFYKVTAEDAAGNVSVPSNEVTATVADVVPPSAPTGLSATAAGTTINLSWTAASDDVGVVRYNVHRGASAGFTPSTANRIGQPTGTTYADTGLASGTYYYKVTAEDAAGNVGPVSNTANATIPDTTPPTAPSGVTATGGAGQATVNWAAATDNVGVVKYNVHRSITSGFTPTTANRIAQPTGTSYTDLGLAAGTYYYKVTAEDAAGNVGPPGNEASATVTAPAPTGLVASYGFDAGSGTTAVDQSGNGNTGSLTNASWAGASAGKFGNALSFNGTNAYVSVPHSTSLALSSGMTIGAWVKPTTLSSSDWNTVAFKERTGYYSWALYANTGSNRPSGNVYTNADYDLRGTAQLPVGVWTHLAATYDGSVLALFVNGAQAASIFVSGSIVSGTGALKIGGNAIWGEYFNGLIDEVRVYSRALSAAEIQADMNTSITSPDAIPPSAPGTLSATGGLGQISLGWGAATDNVGVVKYNVHRSTTAGFTPSTANRIAQPTGTSYTDNGLAAGTYYYKVTAEDAAGNVGPAGNEASAVAVADTTPPTVSITSPIGGATVSATVPVNANAADNGSVAGVQFKVDGANLGAEDTAAPYSVSWDTFTAGNGPHTLSAVARDGAGNTTPSSGVSVTVQNNGSPGLVGAWAFDEGSGTPIGDQSGKGNNGTVTNGTWVTGGKFNNALSFNGTNAWVTIPDSATLDLTAGMTLEAWLKPSILGSWRTAIVKEQPGNLAYGIYANTSTSHPEAEVYVSGATRLVNGTTTLPVGSWSHLAATYDGAALRLYLNGVQVAQIAQSGSILTSSSPLRIGGNGVWGEYFNGLIDEVRVYNRALSAAEIQSDMNRSVTPDTTPPTVIAKTPAAGATGVNAGSSATATFSELMNAGSITTSTFQLKDAANTSVPVNVSYDSTSSVATLSPQSALQYGATYTVTVKGGSGGVSDFAGNTLASDVGWSFTTEASPPQILLVDSTANRFDSYLGEILRNEGVNAFTTIDATFISPWLLSGFDVVVLGETPLNILQISALTDWVNAGGNLIAMRPDKQLAGLLGLTDAGTTLANAYLQVNTSAPPGTGIVPDTIQFHGSADRYTLSGATAVATLYTGPATPTTNPAATLRSVGGSGGQAAAFTYDLARSVVYTRQGNPAWAGQERDGVVGIRPDDLFYGAKAGDVQPDWIDTNKIAIPQADEQQRLLVNLITLMERDRMPLPHFWYLPRGKKAVVLLSGDDHSPSQAPGGTASNFDRFKALSTPGCVVANWECVRATSYIYPDSILTNAQAAGYLADGFEPALHPVFGSCPTAPITEAELGAGFDTQLAQFRAKYTSLPGPFSSRTHCVFWPDWASSAKVELARGIRMDANYYHYPGSWIGTKPGFLNGGGFPMRFADLNGAPIDVYQQNTNLTDETTSAFAATMNTLLDNALGPLGFYGAFGTNIHTDFPAPLPGNEQIVASAQAHGVPLISYKQMLDWVDGRNSSTIRSLSWNAGTFSFVTTVGAGANGLQTMLPTQGPTGTLSALTCGGSPKAYTLQTIKGVQYAMFDAITGACQATYS